MRFTTFVAVLASTLITGCSWVKLVPGAGQVEVVTAAEATQCERIGSATAKSLNKLGFIERNKDKLQTELNTMARNEAEGIGGNTVVAESAITQGQQKFGIYRCP